MPAVATVSSILRGEGFSETPPPWLSELTLRISELHYRASYWESLYRVSIGKQRKLEQEVKELNEKIRLREQQLFGRKSERKGKGQFQEGLGKRRRGRQQGSKGYGRRFFQNLPVVEEERDLNEEEKKCPTCDLPFISFLGTDDSEIVEVEVCAHRRLIRRKRYKRVCQCSGPRIITASPAPKVIPKGSFGVSFWVLVLIDKFLFQRPTSRLIADLRWTQGIAISQGTIVGGLKTLVPLFKPLQEEILSRNRSESHWHADETRWMVFTLWESKQNYKWYLWVIHSSTTVVFLLDPSRSSSVVLQHFGMDARGILNVDRYSAYKPLEKQRSIRLSFCWAHVRRDFLTLALQCPDEKSWAFSWVNLIANLYSLNNIRLSCQKTPDEPKSQRTLKRALSKMKKRRDQELCEDLPQARRKVLESLKVHWPGLILFADHPEIPMDNNQAERDLRNAVVGRKNYYGSGSHWSGQLSATLFSLFQTLLLWKINPRAWLTDYLSACAENGGKAPENARDFLPWCLSREQREGYQNTS